jgi:hypothetical protein
MDYEQLGGNKELEAASTVTDKYPWKAPSTQIYQIQRLLYLIS